MKGRTAWIVAALIAVAAGNALTLRTWAVTVGLGWPW